MVVVAVGVLALGFGVKGWVDADDGSELKIVSSENSTVAKGDTLELKYELAKGQQTTHTHVYLDAQYQKEFSRTFKGLTPGKRETNWLRPIPIMRPWRLKPGEYRSAMSEHFSVSMR
jgi:hypothetical protein